MVAAVVIGLIVSVIDVLVLLIIYFLVNNSKISNEEKRRFNKKIFGSEVKEKIRNIVIIVFINLLIEYFIYSLVFSKDQILGENMNMKVQKFIILVKKSKFRQ